MFCSLHLAMSIYGSNHEQRTINVSYRMDSAIAPDRHSASAERVDSSSVLVAKVSFTDEAESPDLRKPECHGRQTRPVVGLGLQVRPMTRTRSALSFQGGCVASGTGPGPGQAFAPPGQGECLFHPAVALAADKTMASLVLITQVAARTVKRLPECNVYLD